MKQQQKVAMKTMAMKAKFANAVHQLMMREDQLSSDDFQEAVAKLSSECSASLKSFKNKRQRKALVAKLRADRGYISKNRTTLQEYLAKQEAGLFLKVKNASTDMLEHCAQ